MLFLPFHHQSVTHSDLSQQMAGLCGVGFQFLPQVAHVDAQVVALLRLRGAPDFTQELAVRHHASGIADQHRQQAVLNWREVNFKAGAAHQPGHAIDRHIAKAEHRVGSCERVCILCPDFGGIRRLMRLEFLSVSGR